MKTSLLLFVSILMTLSCSHTSSIGKNKAGIPAYRKSFILKDKSGTFNYIREAGIDKKSGNFVIKYEVKDRESGISFERGISLSKPKLIKDKIKVLSPYKSQYEVWFDKKRYKVKMSMLDANRINIQLNSPEKKWSGSKISLLPKGNGVICFFSQVMACAKRIGFIAKALKAQAGKMNFTMIWDGHPYFQEQYLGVKSVPFTTAQLAYDGKNTKNEQRFALNFDNHSIFYFIDAQGDYFKSFWPSQGLSINANEQFDGEK